MISAAGGAVIDLMAPSIWAAKDAFFGDLEASDFDSLCRLAANLVESWEEALKTFGFGQSQEAQ